MYICNVDVNNNLLLHPTFSEKTADGRLVKTIKSVSFQLTTDFLQK